MIEILIFVSGLITGGAVVAIMCYFRHSAAQDELRSLRDKNLELEKQVTALETKQRQDDRNVALLRDSGEHLKRDFENLSNRIFENRSRKFERQNKEQLTDILAPLKEQLKNFEQTFANTDNSFSTKFGELKQQIQGLSDLNKNIGEQAENLTNALKGDVKKQGDWGEMLLEKTLQVSGLRKGIDYEMQKSYTDRDGALKIPDAIVRLPDNKTIVIDAKVSLVNYEAYVSADDEKEQEEALKRHINSVKRHIRELSEKDYQNMPEKQTLNYVLMFTPIEAAHLLILQHERDILRLALHSNIVLACPSTLLAILRTVHALWQLKAQNTNAGKIAEQAGKMYDKFVGFVEKMGTIGEQLERTSRSYNDAYKSLTDGRGNLIRRAAEIKELGAKTAKELPESLVEDSGNTNDTALLSDNSQRPNSPLS